MRQIGRPTAFSNYSVSSRNMMRAQIVTSELTSTQSRGPFVGVAMIVLAILLGGCNRESVRKNLTEDQANEVMAVLVLHEVAATKEALEKKEFEVTVPREDLGYALQIVKQYALPRDIYQTPMCEIFKKQGMISVPIEDRARWMCSKALSLERAVFQGIDGVVTVTSSVSYADRDPFSDKQEAPHASVTIKHVKDARIDVDKVKAIARDSNAGIIADNISVTLFEAQVIPRSTVATSTNSKLIAFWIAMVGLAVLVAGGAVWLYNSRFNPLRRDKKVKASGVVLAGGSAKSPVPNGSPGDD
jgi:type III secretion system YscJ/HrcJ family lipoprotein